MMNKEEFVRENAGKLANKDFVKSHLFIGIQKISNESIVKRSVDFEGLESYLYVRLENSDGIASAKLNQVILNELDMSEEEAWAQAQLNQHAEITVQPIFSAINQLLGSPYDDSDLNFGGESAGLYVVSNNSMQLGASAILDKEIIKEVARKCHTNKFIVCPSSKHEMLLFPDNGAIELEAASELVKQINETEVKPEDRLTDRAYRLAV